MTISGGEKLTAHSVYVLDGKLSTLLGITMHVRM